MALKERQFYNVKTRKKVMIPKKDITVVKFKNGAYALFAVSKEGTKMFKLFSESKIDSMQKKYGKSNLYK